MSICKKYDVLIPKQISHHKKVEKGVSVDNTIYPVVRLCILFNFVHIA